MDAQQIAFLDQYEQNLTDNMISASRSNQYFDGVILETPDIDDKWKEMSAAYVADAVKEIANYPQVALGWAMYMGMAVAQMWDQDWEKYASRNDIYESIRDKRGFDYLDEVVRGEILGLEGTDFTKAENMVREYSQMALDAIRHEQIEPQSPLAFYVYARSIKVLYKIGAAIWLSQLGYKMSTEMNNN